MKDLKISVICSSYMYNMHNLIEDYKIYRRKDKRFWNMQVYLTASLI